MYYSTEIKIVLHENSIIIFGQTRILILRKKYSSVQVSEFRKKFFWARHFNIFVLPLTTATHKRVNFGGHPENAAPQKTTHIIWALLNKLVAFNKSEISINQEILNARHDCSLWHLRIKVV